jgi:hypothetical protein
MSSVVISGDTSGAITLSAPAVAGTNTITLPASTGTVLTTGSPQSGGVIQVVTGTTTSQTTTTSSSFVTTSLTVSITPKFSTSKIFIIVSGSGDATSGSGQQLATNIYRNSTPLSTYGFGTVYGLTRVQGGVGISYLDSPATTSSTSYTVYIASVNNAGTVAFNTGGNNGAQVASITVMEIAA